MIFLMSCGEENSPVQIQPEAIDSSSAPAGRLVFVRGGKRFVSDRFLKDSAGIYHGGYAFYQLSTEELSIYGRKNGTMPEVIHITTKLPVKTIAPKTIANYTIEYQEGIILKGKAYQTDAQHFGTYRLTKFDLGAGLVSGTFESVLKQTFPVDQNDTTKIQYGSFTDLPMIIMD
jgi:hypothetical protein